MVAIQSTSAYTSISNYTRQTAAVASTPVKNFQL